MNHRPRASYLPPGLAPNYGAGVNRASALALLLAPSSPAPVPPVSPPVKTLVTKPSQSHNQTGENPRNNIPGEQVQGAGARLWGGQLRWGGPKDQGKWGGAFTQQGFGLFAGNFIHLRYLDRINLGGQGGAFHYRLAVQAALGAIWRVAGDHGPIVRLGIDIDWQRGPFYRTRWLRVPELHLGWSGIEGAFQYEIAATGSPYVFHRALRGSRSAMTTEHSASVGALSSFIYKRLRFNLRADWTWIWGTPQPRWAGDLCVYLGARPPKARVSNPELARRKEWFGSHEQRYRAGLCANALVSYISGSQGPVQTQQIAFSIMLGKISFLDPIQ